MSDPISGAGGGAAKLALQEMMKQQQQQQLQNQANPAGQASFQQKLDGVQQPQEISEVQKSHEATKPRSIRELAGIQNTQGTQNVQNPQRIDGTQKAQNAQLAKADGNQPGEMTKGLGKFMETMKGRKQELDTMIQKAMQGKSFSNSELLALQFKVASFSMEMDLTSKVVEKATGGIKQAMNTQV